MIDKSITLLEYHERRKAAMVDHAPFVPPPYKSSFSR